MKYKFLKGGGIIISPVILKRIAENREEENYEFRAFLKNQDDKEVDRLVHRYHKELYSEEFCKSCMNCCREYSVELDDEEQKAAAELLKISVEELNEKYLSNDGASSTCSFFKDNKCLIEEAKPGNCIEYPYTQKEGFVFRLLSIVENYSVCPLVFEIYERLKEHYTVEFEEYNNMDWIT